MALFLTKFFAKKHLLTNIFMQGKFKGWNFTCVIFPCFFPKKMPNSIFWSLLSPKQRKNPTSSTFQSIRYYISHIKRYFHFTLHLKTENFFSTSPFQTQISLPYFHDIIYQISKILAKKNIKTLFKPHKTLKPFLKALKINLTLYFFKVFTKSHALVVNPISSNQSNYPN